MIRNRKSSSQQTQSSQQQYAISIDDIERATKKLKVLGNGIAILNIGQKKMVQTVPCELNIDHTAILTLAQETRFVSVSQIKAQLQWGPDRISSVLVTIKARKLTEFS
jgi:ESCRT-II complex subunit VPS22